MIIKKTVFVPGLIFILLSLVQPEDTEKQEAVREAAAYHVIAAAEENFEEATDNWNVMQERLDAAIQNGKGENVNFQAGNRITVTEDILKKLSGENATLGLHASNGVTFSVSGRDVKETDTPICMEVVFESTIPDETMRQLQGYRIAKQFYMVEKDSYPCRVNVHMALGTENTGKHAVLYSYDEAGGGLRQEEIYRITGDGHAIFGLNRGDEYVVAVMEGYTVMPGDTISHIALRHGVSMQELMAVNPQIPDIDRIQTGQMLNLPKNDI